MTLPGGRTKSTGRSRILRRFFGIQARLCAVLTRFIIIFPRELGGNTDTCKTSLDIRWMLLSCERLRLCRLSLTFVLTRLRSLIGVSQQERRHGGWRMAIYYGTLQCLTLGFCHHSEASKWGADHCTSVGAVRGERLTWYLWDGYLRCCLCWWAVGSGGEPGGRGGIMSSRSSNNRRISCSWCLGLVFYFSYFDDIGLYVCILMTLVRMFVFWWH